MRVRRIEIENFRGIRSLDFRIPADQKFICLIGPGDSAKSTIIDAIHLALGERWALSIDDTDFFMGNIKAPFHIRIAVADLSSDVLGHPILGMNLSGIADDGEWQHDPSDDTEPCVIVELRVDQDLDPSWTVYRPGGAPGPNLSAGTRRLLSAFRVDDRVDHHLRWAKTSALTRLTDASHGTAGTLAVAVVAARDAVNGSISPELATLTDSVAQRLSDLGSGDFTDLRPGLDTSMSGSNGTLALFEGPVPLTRFGLGTRRLAGIATQELASATKSVILIDEIEHGLEPHRLVFLLKRLRDADYPAQVFVTTHSPIAVEQLDATDIAIVRSNDGEVTCRLVPPDLTFAQATLRGGPSSFLARRVVVTEGGTEFGLLLEIVESWDRRAIEDGTATSASHGVAIADGGGSKAPARATVLAELGYDVALLVDNDDRTIDSAVARAAAAGVQVFRWRQGLAVEDELVSELDAPLMTSLLATAVTTRASEHTVLDDLKSSAGFIPLPGTLNVSSWIADNGLTLEQARAVIAQAAKGRRWFKAIPAGRVLAQFVIDNGPAVVTTSFATTLLALKDFIYPAAPSPEPDPVDVQEPE